MLDRVREDVLAYEAMGASDGVVLHYLLDRLAEVVPLLRADKSDENLSRRISNPSPSGS